MFSALHLMKFQITWRFCTEYHDYSYSTCGECRFKHPISWNTYPVILLHSRMHFSIGSNSTKFFCLFLNNPNPNPNTYNAIYRISRCAQSHFPFSQPLTWNLGLFASQFHHEVQNSFLLTITLWHEFPCTSCTSYISSFQWRSIPRRTSVVPKSCCSFANFSIFVIISPYITIIKVEFS